MGNRKLMIDRSLEMLGEFWKDLRRDMPTKNSPIGVTPTFAWRKNSKGMFEWWAQVIKRLGTSTAAELVDGFASRIEKLRAKWMENGGYILNAYGVPRNVLDYTPRKRKALLKEKAPDVGTLRGELALHRVLLLDALGDKKNDIDTAIIAVGGSVCGGPNWGWPRTRRRAIGELRATFEPPPELAEEELLLWDESFSKRKKKLMRSGVITTVGQRELK